MTTATQTRWAEHALATLQAAGYRRGGARTAVVEALLATTAPSLPWTWTTSCVAASPRSAARASTAPLSSSSSSTCSGVSKSTRNRGLRAIEPDGEHHHHAICRDCGRMIPFEDASLERAIDKVSGRISLTPPSTR